MAARKKSKPRTPVILKKHRAKPVAVIPPAAHELPVIIAIPPEVIEKTGWETFIDGLCDLIGYERH